MRTTHTYIYAHGVAGPFVASHKGPATPLYIIMYDCVTLRNAIILRTAHGVAGPFVANAC